jgi:hypothetical protein
MCTQSMFLYQQLTIAYINVPQAINFAALFAATGICMFLSSNYASFP